METQASISLHFSKPLWQVLDRFSLIFRCEGCLGNMGNDVLNFSDQNLINAEFFRRCGAFAPPGFLNETIETGYQEEKLFNKNLQREH